MSLIVSETPVQRLNLTRRVSSKAIALVGKTPDDHYQIVRRFGMFSPYRLAYEVDVADHHDDVEASLPSQGDVFEFKLRLVIDWRVTDPVRIVARGVDDGLALCKDHLVDLMRDITRRWPIESSFDAETEIRRTLGSDAIVLPEGITVCRVRPQLTIDQATRNAGHALAAAHHDGTLALIKGQNAITEAHHESDILSIKQKAELTRRREALDAIHEALHGKYDPIAFHLAQHPDQTKELVTLIQTNHRESQDRRDGLIRELVRRELIQDIDVGDLTSALLSNAADAYRAGPQVIQSVVTPQNGAAHTNASSTSAQNGETRPAAETPAPDTGTPPDDSGVVGWRPVPPRTTD
jgi:hypothetical protein